MSTDMETLLLSVSDAARVCGMSRSTLYRKLASGEIVARKIGRSTKIEADGLRAMVAGLPRAEFRVAAQGRARR